MRESSTSSGNGSRRVRRVRRLIMLVAFFALSVTFAAGTTGAESGSGPTLVVDNSFALDTLDPQRAYNPTSYLVLHAVYDTLFTYKGDDLTHPVPLLVRAWTTRGYRSFTFSLRRDAHFADGTRLTSADVVFSLRRLVDVKGSPSYLLAGTRISAKGDETIVVTTRTPEPQLPSILALPPTGIVEAKLAEAHGGGDGANAATDDTAEHWFNSSSSAGAGSGPYELESYETDSQVVLRPNPDYWGARKPAFGEIVIRNMPAVSQLLNITRGAHQIAIDLSSTQGATLRGDASLHLSIQPSPWTFYAFTNDNPKISRVTSNPRFQQAVRDALDYKSITELAGAGAIQDPGIIPSMILGALSQADGAKQDLGKAKAELAASGVGRGEVTLEYPSDLTLNGVAFATLAQRVQANLSEAGLNVRLAGSPIATLQARVRAGQVPFGLWAYAFNYPDPADYLVFTPGQLIALEAGWKAGSDPAVEKLAREAVLATTPSARRSLFRQIQLGVNARGPFIPLIQPAQVFVATSDLSGAVFSAIYDLDLTQITPN